MADFDVRSIRAKARGSLAKPPGGSSVARPGAQNPDSTQRHGRSGVLGPYLVVRMFYGRVEGGPRGPPYGSFPIPNKESPGRMWSSHILPSNSTRGSSPRQEKRRK